MGQVHSVEAARQQGEPEQRSSRPPTFGGQEVQVPGHWLIEQVAHTLQHQTSEAAAEHAQLMAPQPTDKVKVIRAVLDHAQLCLGGTGAWRTSQVFEDALPEHGPVLKDFRGHLHLHRAERSRLSSHPSPSPMTWLCLYRFWLHLHLHR